jgi:HEAT repeat protein
VDALLKPLDVDALTTGRRRASAIVRGFGSKAITRLAPLVGNGRWYAQRNAAELLGDTASPDAVPLLQPLLRGGEPRVMQAAVRALSNIDDPAAARSVHTILRAAAGEHRQAVVLALVAERDPRVVPVLVRILNESDPLGADHQVALDALGAIGKIGGDQAIPDVTRAMERRAWLGRRKLKAIKQASLEALRAIDTPASRKAIAQAADTGDRLLKKLARALPEPKHG